MEHFEPAQPGMQRYIDKNGRPLVYEKSTRRKVNIQKLLRISEQAKLPNCNRIQPNRINNN